MSHKHHLVFLLGIAVVIPSRLYALGTTALSNDAAAGAKPLGMFNCVVAQADDPTSIYFNPAGLVQMSGYNVSLNDNIIDMEIEHEARNGTKTKTESDLIHIPSVFAVYGDDRGIAYGIGAYSTYGLETRWGSQSFSKDVATLSRFHMFTVNPTISLKADEHISFGMGLDAVEVFNVDLQKEFDQSPLNGAPSPDGHSRQSLKGSGLGANFGVLYKFNPVHSVGLAYRSSIKLRLRGTQELKGLTGTTNAIFGGSEYTSGASASIDLPQTVILGYAFRPTKKWTLEMDGQWTDWSTVEDFNVHFEEQDPTRNAILQAGIDPATRDWEDAYSIGLGTAYDFNAKWTGRLGIGYLEKAVPEKTFDSALPDSDRIEATTGFTYRIKRTRLHFAYNAAFFRSRSISNNVGGGAINGTYRTFVNAWAFGVEQKF